MITSQTKNSISVFIFYSLRLDTIFGKLSTDFSFLFSTISYYGKQKSSQISLRADCHSGGVGGIRTHARGKPSNDLAKMPKLQFVVLTLNLSLYIVVAHCKIILKMF